MWLIRWIFVAAVIILLLIFALQNTQETSVKLLGYQSPEIPLSYVVFFSFAAGFILFLIVGIYHQLRHSTQLSKLKREIRDLNAECRQLREANPAQVDNPDAEK